MTTKEALQQKLDCAKLVEEFSAVGNYLRLQTRLLYPDGSNIDVFLNPEPPRLRMSDLGNTMTWLSHLGIRPWQTLRRREQVDEMLRGLGVELDGGELVSSVLPGEHESLAMIRVAQACTRLADLYLTKRQQVAQFREDVEEVVSTFDLPYTVDEQLLGRSGERVSVDMLVRGKEKTSAVLCIEPIRANVDDAHHRWFELLERGEKRVTIYNDRRRELDRSSRAYLSEFSLVLPFSAQEEVRFVLAA